MAIKIPTAKDFLDGVTWYIRGDDHTKAKRFLSALVIGILIYPAATQFTVWYQRLMWARNNNQPPQYASPGNSYMERHDVVNTPASRRDPVGENHDHRSVAEAAPIPLPPTPTRSERRHR